MALHDIVATYPILVRLERGDIGTLTEIGYTGRICGTIDRGDIGDLTEIVGSNAVAELSRTLPDPDEVKHGAQFGTSGNEFTGTLIVGGMASSYATLAKETGANARGGSGICAKFSPTSTANYGYWHFYIAATESVDITLSFYHKISAAWNGLLKISILDTDQTTELLSSESVTTVNDGSYHLHTCDTCTPSSDGFILARFEIKDGSTTGYVYVDDINIA